MHKYTKAVLTVIALFSCNSVLASVDLSGKYLVCKQTGERYFTDEHLNHTFITFVSETKVLIGRGIRAEFQYYYSTDRNPTRIWMDPYDPVETARDGGSLAFWGQYFIDRKSLVLEFDNYSNVKQQCEVYSADQMAEIKQKLITKYSKDFKL